MKIVIVEDEVMIARRLKHFCEKILTAEITSITHFLLLDDAEDYLSSHPIDLLLLDLNLNNRDGFELLKGSLTASYHTIVVSANSERAIEAFEYGVLDFVAKPFTEQRLEKAFQRLQEKRQVGNNQTKFLAVKKLGRIELIDINQIAYIKASSQYSEIFMLDESVELHDKNLERLLQVLPENFQRVHKSFAIPLNQVSKLHKRPGSKYELELSNASLIPLGRTRYPEIKLKLGMD